jgi:activating signal cointegrator 1
MKTLSIRQPWATLLCLGVKRYETRSWKTGYRGPLAIHAGKELDRLERPARVKRFLRELLAKAGYPEPHLLPRGCVIGVADLVDCVPTEAIAGLTKTDRYLGDFRPGRWAWRFREARLLNHPLPVRGWLSLFDLDLDALLTQTHPLFASHNHGI